MAPLVKNLRRAAEFIAVICFTAMFAGFILQVVTRYVLNDPLDWTQELCVVLYLFGVFWTAAFLLKESDHVTFTVLYDHASLPIRRIMAAIGAIAIGVGFLADLPGAWDYVTYMKANATPVLHLRFDFVFGIFILFMLAVIWRAGVLLVGLVGPHWREKVEVAADSSTEEAR
jgi:TRAP-type C4-dicarboxylate transport system permease small subunit